MNDGIGIYFGGFWQIFARQGMSAKSSQSAVENSVRSWRLGYRIDRGCVPFMVPQTSEDTRQHIARLALSEVTPT